jgi:hypothetical protein
VLEAITPKITEISSMKGISALLALPMLCVAYFLQTGATIEWDGTVWFGLGENLPPETELRRLIIIFVLKSVWVSLFGAVGYGLLSYLQINVDFPVVQLASVVIIALALFGLFCSNLFTQLKLIDPFWFYGLVVWGVFLSTMKEQFDAERQRIEAAIEARRKSKHQGNVA